MKRFPILAVIGLLLLAFSARVADLGGPSFWYDEGFSVMAARLPLKEMLGLVAQTHNTPLHYLALRIWVGFAGDREFASRALSALAGVLAVAAAGRIVVFAGRRRALEMSLLLAAVFPVAVALSREARQYGLLMFLVTLVGAETLRLLRKPTGWRWLGWAALCVGAFSTHVLGGLAWACSAALLGLHFVTRRELRKRDVRLGLGIAAVTGIVVGAWAFLLFVTEGERSAFSGPVNPVELLADGLITHILPRMEPNGLTMLAAAFATALVVLGLWRPSARTAVFFALLYMSGAVAIGVITGKFAGRYMASAAIVLSAGVSIAVMESPRPGIVGAVTAIALAGAGWIGITTVGAANEDFRGVAQYLQINAAPDEPILLVSGYYAPAFEYYYGSSGWVALPDDPVPDVSKVFDYALAAPALNQALIGKRGAWLVRWQDMVADPTGLMRDMLRRQSVGYTSDKQVKDFHGLMVDHYKFNDVWRPIPLAVPIAPSEIVGGAKQVGLSGTGCAQFQPALVSEAYFEVACVWQLRPFVGLPYDAQVSIRIEDRQGKRILQSDQQLLSNGLPGLRFEKPLLGLYLLQMPPNIPPGDYTLRAIPYHDGTEWAPTLVSTIRFDP